MLETLAGMETEVNDLALANTESGMEVMPSGKVIDVSEVFSNAELPMDVTLFGIEIDDNELADKNAWFPILVKFGGREIEINPVAFENALFSILVILDGKEIDVSAECPNDPAPMAVTPSEITTSPAHWTPATTVPLTIWNLLDELTGVEDSKLPVAQP